MNYSLWHNWYGFRHLLIFQISSSRFDYNTQCIIPIHRQKAVLMHVNSLAGFNTLIIYFWQSLNHIGKGSSIWQNKTLETKNIHIIWLIAVKTDATHIFIHIDIIHTYMNCVDIIWLIALQTDTTDILHTLFWEMIS